MFCLSSSRSWSWTGCRPKKGFGSSSRRHHEALRPAKRTPGTEGDVDKGGRQPEGEAGPADQDVRVGHFTDDWGH